MSCRRSGGLPPALRHVFPVVIAAPPRLPPHRNCDSRRFPLAHRTGGHVAACIHAPLPPRSILMGGLAQRLRHPQPPPLEQPLHERWGVIVLVLARVPQELPP